MATGEHLVFVYGTLRKEAPDPTPYFLHGYAMFPSTGGRFPYITAGEGVVTGQILRVDDPMLEELDLYEGLSYGLYTREKVTVLNLESDPIEEVWAYVAGPELLPSRIPSGDWNQFISNKR